MAAKLFYLPFPTAFSSNGLPEAGATATFYLTGTTTKTPAYTTSALTTQHTNPVTANGAGRLPAIYLDDTITYRMVIKDAAGSTLEDVDPFIPGVAVGTDEAVAAAEAVIAAHAFTVTSATGQTVSTRTLLAGLTSPTVGQSAYLNEKGRGGMFQCKLWSDYSTLGTSDTLQGIFVRSTADTTKVWVRQQYLDKPGFYEANWWGYDPAIDSASILNAIFNPLWEALGGGELLIPNGTMTTSIALQDTSLSNAQIVLPKVSTRVIPLRLRAACPQMTGDPTTGVIWQSTLTAGPGNVVGCRSSINVSLLNLYVDGITVRCPQNPKLVGFNASYILMSEGNLRVDVPNVQVGSPLSPLTITEPTDNTSYGFKSPLNDISAYCRINVQVVGFYTGVLIGELYRGEWTAVGCKKGFISQTGSHRSGPWVGMAIACQVDFYIDGTLELDDCSFNLEHDPLSTSGGIAPTWISPRGYSIDASGDAMRGKLKIGFHNESVSPFTINPIIKGLEIAQVPNPSVESASSFGLGYPGMLSDTNRSSVRFLRGINGAIMMDLFEAALSTTNGILGQRMSTNGNKTGTSDLRMVVDQDVIDGNINNGAKEILCYNGASSRRAIRLGYSGIQCPDIITAADDAAAATAGVPVKGLYMHSDGTPRFRVA